MKTINHLWQHFIHQIVNLVLYYPSFNRNYKRNMTLHLNQVSQSHFNQNKNQNTEQFSVFDFYSLNFFSPNSYNNSFNSICYVKKCPPPGVHNLRTPGYCKLQTPGVCFSRYLI